MNQEVFKKRIYATALLFIIIVLLFIIKIFNLHFSEKIILSQKEPKDNGRGFILDKNGYHLAMSIEYNSVFANPAEVEKTDSNIFNLSSVLGIPVSEIKDKLTSNKKFVWLLRKCDEETIKKVQSLKIKGIYLRKEYRRVYPYNDLASNIIGFVGVDNNGLEGIEYNFDKILSGKDEIVNDETDYPAYQPKDITLTIDRFIQHVAEEELSKTIKSTNARQGAVIIMEVKTGRILAFAKKPSFNPNNLTLISREQLNNFSFVDAFEPGSTFKVMALIALMENNPEALQKGYFCDGYVDINDVHINCLHKHGNVTIRDIIAYSCNAGMIQAVQPLHKTAFYEMLKKFGFGEKTGIEIPGEATGILRPVKQWSGLSKYSLSIGHEISVNSIQLTAAFNAIANDGVYMSPSIIEKISKKDGSPTRSFFPTSKGRVINISVAKAALASMRDVVVRGTGKRADSAFYQIAGKTGTAQKFSSDTGAYSNRNISSFIGIAPYDNPVITMLVVFDDPGDKKTGGVIAAPVFMNIVERTLPYLGLGGKDISNLRVKKTSQGMQRMDYTTMPDLSGMTISEASIVLQDLTLHYDIKYYVKGYGRVAAQKPSAGTKLNKNDSVFIILK
ncbi:MAG TPA: penicillin-binding transpeptidase domain-containing protein [Spirochaetota bacterium]|nr:penicillin-binding transpeptidase domain-containing protein [Spirochaetota bacterium]HPD79093.1 penicillin-binding transpeptidase domain-containing protein [Spirochaetota bacterium]